MMKIIESKKLTGKRFKLYIRTTRKQLKAIHDCRRVQQEHANFLAELEEQEFLASPPLSKEVAEKYLVPSEDDLPSSPSFEIGVFFVKDGIPYVILSKDTQTGYLEEYHGSSWVYVDFETTVYLCICVSDNSTPVEFSEWELPDTSYSTYKELMESL